jgi:hypothetical protein
MRESRPVTAIVRRVSPNRFDACVAKSAPSNAIPAAESVAAFRKVRSSESSDGDGGAWAASTIGHAIDIKQPSTDTQRQKIGIE